MTPAELASQHFGINLPTTQETLKKAFWSQAKNLHPDTVGSHEQFLRLKQAYDLLLKLPGVFGSQSIKTTTDGSPLYELGLGLGPTMNGRDCPRCSHLGYSISYGRAFKVCEECDENGYVNRFALKCGSCNGTGKFTQAKSKRVVDCLTCDGTGLKTWSNPSFFTFQFRRCPKCLGTKMIWTKTEEEFYSKCFECSGTGEIRVWNPVIPKGLLR